MIVWNAVFVLCFFSSTSLLATWAKGMATEYFMTMALYPAIGLIADIWIGRYKILMAVKYLLIVAVALALTNLHFLTCVIIALLGLAAACYIACFFQFTTDQLVGASGEQLSFTIYWLMWGLLNGEFMTNLVLMLPDEESGYFLLGISALSAIAGFSMMECCSHWLMKKPVLSNPIKHIAKVLNYARKHKFPERRSALTYWEEDYPSRIDLGKDRYGGPFTVEEVEDVKTVLRLIPLVMVVTASAIPVWGMPPLLHSSGNIFTAFGMYHGNLAIAIRGLVSTFGLPVYHFLVYPVF